MSRDKYIDLINKATQQYNLPVGLLSGVIQRESAFNPLAKSPAGAMGLMQLMPGTAKDLGVTDPFDPEQSIMGGANYLSQQLKAFDNDPKLALAAYNAGPGNVKKYGGIPPFKETQNYVPSVLDAATKFGFGAPAQPEATQSPIQNLMSQMPEPMGMDQMKSMVGLDDPTLKRQNKMNFIGSILNGLAQVTGSFNPNRGAALQQMYANQNQNNVKLQAAQRESAIANLMKLSEINTTKNPMLTDDIKEYTFAAQNGFKGSFEDWMKQKSTMNPLGLLNYQYKIGRDIKSDADKEEKKAQDLSELQIPGYELTGETRPLPAEAAKLRSAKAELDTFEKGIKDLVAMTDKYGTVELTGPASAQMDALTTGLHMSLKNIQELGVLAGPDMALLQKQIDEMNSLGSFFTKSSTKNARLNQVLKTLKSKVGDKLTTSGYRMKGSNSPIQQMMGGQDNASSQQTPVGQNNQINKFKNMSDEELMKLAAERWGE